MKLTKVIIITASLLSCIHQQAKAQQNNTGPERKRKVAIIGDTRFRWGIGLIGASSAHPEITDTLRPFGSSKEPPIWKMPQWATRYDLKGIPPVKKNDTIIYQNRGKKVWFLDRHRQTTLGLEVYGSKEYLKPRIQNEAWPHLLLEQRTDQTRLSQMNALDYRIEARLNYSINKTGSAYDPGLHAAQVTLYLLVQNVNKGSEGLGDYFWFGLPLYDNRHVTLEEYAAQDLGKEDATKKFILNVASKTLFEGSLHNKKWINIHKDIYPLLVSAFKKAQQNGYLKTSTFEDMAIESTNVGWEIPGTFDCGIQFRNLALTATIK